MATPPYEPDSPLSEESGLRALVQRELLSKWIDDELRLVEQAGSGASSRIINVCGLPGLGKTIFAQQLLLKLTGYHLIAFDFAPDQEARPTAQTWQDALSILREWTGLSHLSTTIQMTTGETFPTDQVSLNFRATPLQTAFQQPLIVLLDHVDNLGYWKWFQTEILLPLITHHPTLTLAFSQTRLRWDAWELIARTHPSEMPPFSLDETRQFLRAYDRELITEAAHDLTLGYPGHLQELLSFLEEDQAEESTPFPPVETTHLTANTRELLVYVGLLRRLEVPIMQALLDHFMPQWHQGRSVYKIFMDQLFPDLAGHGVLKGYKRGYPVQLHGAVRQRWQSQLRDEEPERYLQVCQFLQTLYANQFLSKPLSQIDAFVEWLYFTALEIEHQGTKVDSQWESRLQKLLRRIGATGSRLVPLLYKDPELMAMLDRLELSEILQRNIQEHLRQGAEPSYLLNPSELSRYRHRVLQNLSTTWLAERLRQHIPYSLEQLLLTIAALGSHFDVPMLYHTLQKIDPDIKQMKVNFALSLLESVGLIELDRSLKKFTLIPPLRVLLPGHPAAASVGSGLAVGQSRHGGDSTNARGAG